MKQYHQGAEEIVLGIVLNSPGLTLDKNFGHVHPKELRYNHAKQLRQQRNKRMLIERADIGLSRKFSRPGFGCA